MEHDGHVLEWVIDHQGIVTLHICDACMTPEELIHKFERAIEETRAYIESENPSGPGSALRPDPEGK